MAGRLRRYEHVGSIHADEDRVVFAYAQDYRGPAISYRLPVRDEPFSGRETPEERLECLLSVANHDIALGQVSEAKAGIAELRRAYGL